MGGRIHRRRRCDRADLLQRLQRGRTCQEICWLVFHLNVNFIHACLRLGMGVQVGKPITDPDLSIADILNEHAPPLPFRGKPAAACPAELKGHDLLLAILRSYGVRAYFPRVVSVGASDLLLVQNRISQNCVCGHCLHPSVREGALDRFTGISRINPCSRSCSVRPSELHRTTNSPSERSGQVLAWPFAFGGHRDASRPYDHHIFPTILGQ